MMNEEIRDREVRVIDQNGEQLGVLQTSAALAMEIGNELTMSLITLDVPRAMPYSAAMHTYFAVSDYEQVAITGLEECDFTEFAIFNNVLFV